VAEEDRRVKLAVYLSITLAFVKDSIARWGGANFMTDGQVSVELTQTIAIAACAVKDFLTRYIATFVRVEVYRTLASAKAFVCIRNFTTLNVTCRCSG
jgi:hypothetical protein